MQAQLMQIYGLKAALNSSGRYSFRLPESTVDYLVIGGGVVGLAIARTLSLRFPDKTTFLVERNGSFGEETSSRNSEVIHAGLYYRPNSLKERLCIRGRHLLYSYCKSSGVPCRKTEKLVVAYQHQKSYLEKLYNKSKSLKWHTSSIEKEESVLSQLTVPTTLLSGAEARELEPDLSPNITTALLSHETGILDSHSFMTSLEQDIRNSENGELLYSTAVVRVDPYDFRKQIAGYREPRAMEQGWVIQLITKGSCGGTDSVFARNLVNSSGLSANLILNSLLPQESRIPLYYARGSYAAYNGPGTSKVTHLIYPCPDTENQESHGFQSLGTHLTLDLDGNIKFGPDIQWITPPRFPHSTGLSTTVHERFLYSEKETDFWKQFLIPDGSQLSAMHESVKMYLPGIELSRFRPDYVGIRPKLVSPLGGFQDFVIRKDYADMFISPTSVSPGHQGLMITLLGIESPGLTSSLAIAERVTAMLEGFV